MVSRANVNKRRCLGRGLQRFATASCFAVHLSGASSVGEGTRQPNIVRQDVMWLAGAVKNADLCKWDYALAAWGSLPPLGKTTEVNVVLLEASLRGYG